MSSYHSSFSYLKQNSKDNFNLIISHFDADQGESETGLATESIYTASADGTKRNLYGTKYSGAEPVRITLIKQNGGEFSVDDNRKILKWLTGAQTDSWLDLKVGDEIQYRMFGHVQNVLQYKLDARIVGIIVVFESASPWAFSDLQKQTESISGTKTISVVNQSDDLYGYTSVNVIYKNTKENGSLVLQNASTNETTSVSGLGANETIILNANQMITSDNPARVFGNNFNFIFPRLISGINTLTVTGDGTITFEYYYCIKIGDMATNLNADTDPICDEEGNIEIDVLSWNRIVNTPTTLAGYGISDAYPISSVYNKNEINTKLDALSDETKSATSLTSNLASELAKNYYTKSDIENSYYSKYQIDNLVYTKTDVDNKMDDLEFDVKSNASLISSISSDLTNRYYTKTQIDSILSSLDIPDIDISQLDTYTKAEIDEKLKNITASGVDINEDELNAMLAAVLV